MSLEKILNAESVAIVGASKNETKRGYQTIRTLLEEKYEGRIYPVNPKEKSILGFKCYKKVSDIRGAVDVALVATPAGSLPVRPSHTAAKWELSPAPNARAHWITAHLLLMLPPASAWPSCGTGKALASCRDNFHPSRVICA